MTIQLMKRLAIIQLGAVEEKSLKEEATLLKQMSRGMTNLVLGAIIVINLDIMLHNIVMILMMFKKNIIL